MPDWHHAPIHRLGAVCAYIVTAGTLHKINHFQSPDRLTIVRDSLFDLAGRYGWSLQAWAVMANHYHFVATSDNPGNLGKMLSHLHTVTGASSSAASRPIILRSSTISDW